MAGMTRMRLLYVGPAILLIERSLRLDLLGSITHLLPARLPCTTLLDEH